MEGKAPRKWKLSTFLALFLALGLLYVLTYLFFRSNHDIVHYQVKGAINQHQVEAYMPQAQDLYMETILSTESATENAQEQLQSKLNYHTRKKKSLNAIFFPLQWIEVWYWENLHP